MWMVEGEASWKLKSQSVFQRAGVEVTMDRAPEMANPAMPATAPARADLRHPNNELARGSMEE
jgi:hypothetical protein